MTTFVLIPGAWLGAWAWETVARELEAHGHRAVPVSLSADAGTDLAAHVAEVEKLLDLEGPGVVLVGHSYGIFPAIGAADRRPGQVERLVFVDAGIPENGESLAGHFLDCKPREQLLQSVVDGLLPVPPPEAMSGPGGLTGVADAELDRLRTLATPQPVATLTQPIELTGDWRSLPTTGVFCLSHGLSIEVARHLHATGEPRFAKLAEPGVTFFELNTGHFPMLSAPAELAEALEAAAAGEGSGLYPVDATDR